MGWLCFEISKAHAIFHRSLSNFEASRRSGLQSCLSPSLSNLHILFHVSLLWKYVPDSSHVIQMDDVQVRDNLTVEVLWGGPARGSMTWEQGSQMRESYPNLFCSVNFRVRKFYKEGVVTPWIQLINLIKSLLFLFNYLSNL